MDTEDKPVILIADDSRVVRVSLKNILKDDCHLIEAEDGQQAWELLLEHPHVQLIFSDLSMPRLDGHALLEKIRQSEITRIKNLPFIVVTGNEDDAKTRNRLLESGATEIVTKPFDTPSILNLASTLIAPQESESIYILPDESLSSEFIPETAGQQEFMKAASKELSFAIRNKNELAIALVRIDQFDELGDHYSEHAVEHILMNLAEIIRLHIHPDDTVGYLENGLYAILRPASNAIGTRYIGRRILEDLASKQFCLGESEEVISASVGISAPEIKPGTRLKELLLLAESRLKSAIDLGGNRVIDKGNERLQTFDIPVEPEQDSTSLHSSFFDQSFLSPTSSSQSQQHSAPSSKPPLSRSGDSETSPQVADLQRQISLLIQENQDLQAQVLRWHGQSGESEQLRQRVFELESEQQQMQLRISELHTTNRDLEQRLTESTKEKQELMEQGQEHSVTLEQANQFYAEENQQLQSQINALNERSQKAEFAFKEAQQQNTGLRNSITQLKEQLEQVQQQLIDTQRQAQESQPAAQVKKESIANEEFSSGDSSILDQPTESELLFNGFPSSKDSSKLTEPDTELVVDKEEKAPIEKSEAKIPIVNPESISIPVYQHEPEALPKERRPLSSFAIASIILALFLGAGGFFLYQYLQQPQESAVSESIEPEKTVIAKPTERVDRQKEEVAAGNQSLEKTSVVSTETKASPETELRISKPAPQPSPAPATTSVAPAPTPAAPAPTPAAAPAPTSVAPAPTPAAPAPTSAAPSPTPAVTAPTPAVPATTSIPEAMAEPVKAAAEPSEEARLEAELMLRQMAEEEFNQQLRKLGTISGPSKATTSPTSATEAESSNAQPEVTE